MGWEPVSPTWRKHKYPIRVEDTGSHPTQENSWVSASGSARKIYENICGSENTNNINVMDPTERIHKKKTWIQS